MFSYNICLSDERDDQGLDVLFKVKLSELLWSPNLTDSLHYQFQDLSNKLEREVSFCFHMHVFIFPKVSGMFRIL